MLDLCGVGRSHATDAVKGVSCIAPRAPAGWKTIRSKGEKVTLEDDVHQAPWKRLLIPALQMSGTCQTTPGAAAKHLFTSWPAR